jgi:hypothetical protein
MKPLLLSSLQLAGIEEKLKRADENVHNLGVEIGAFLKASPDAGVANDKRKAAEEWLKFHVEREIPPRFPVLAGEVIHHLRSSLDHIAWILSSESYRQSNERDITFPILTTRPKQDKKSAYDRKIKGITAPAALTLIEQLQPYNVGNSADQPLAIIQDLDNFDKHRALVLVEATFDALISLPTRMLSTTLIGDDQSLKENEYSFTPDSANKGEIKFSRQVAFAEFGERKRQPVVPSLTQLTRELRNIVRKFGDLRTEP